MTSDHRLSLFEFLHAADRLLWSYRSAIDRNARARLTSDDLLLNDFCARAASRARCLLDDELARRARDGGIEPHPTSERDDGDATPAASDDEGGEAAGSGGGRGRAHARRPHAAGMSKLHAAIQARRTAEAQRAAAAASSRDRSPDGAADEARADDSEWDEPTSSATFGDLRPDEGWEHGPDPFATDPASTFARSGARADLPTSNTWSDPAVTATTTGEASGPSYGPSRRRSPR